MLNKAAADASHDFWPDDISLATPGILNPKVMLTSGAVTDVYLLALAVKHAGRLVTLDTRISRETVVDACAEHLVLL